MMARWKAGVQYRDVPGFAAYRVGSDGSLWSQYEIKCAGPGQIWSELSGVWKRLSENRLDRVGRVKVTLYRDGKPFYFHLHRLVLMAFVGSCPCGMECCHNDGNPRNNRLENLRYGTRKENADDRTKHDRTVWGEKSHLAKLTGEQVVEIRRLRSQEHMTQAAIARRFGVTDVNIGSIVKNETWKQLLNK